VLDFQCGSMSTSLEHLTTGPLHSFSSPALISVCQEARLGHQPVRVSPGTGCRDRIPGLSAILGVKLFIVGLHYNGK
jgi:hypothetical protein